MKHIKHIHDEDYDFSIKLMVPLLSILVCTICLCATTWAWYTASVSTGVTSIKAKANVTESVSCVGECNYSKIDDGEYVLEPGEYKLSFTNTGDAEYGYYALIDLEDRTDTLQSNTASIIDLFINRVYAEESEAQVQTINNKGYFYIKKSSENLSFPIIVDSEKILKIQYVWGVKDDKTGQIILEEKYASYENPINTESGINLLQDQPTAPATITFNYIDATTGKPLPYSVFGIEPYGLRENEEDLPQTATIVYEADGEDIEIVAPEGYLLKMDDSFGETENVESRIYRIETDEDIVINVYCVEIPKDTTVQDNNDDTELDNTAESEAVITDATLPTIENNSDETETSDSTNQNSSTEIPSVDETNQSDTNAESSSDKPIESLLITDSINEGISESNPSSYETNSGTEKFAE